MGMGPRTGGGFGYCGGGAAPGFAWGAGRGRGGRGRGAGWGRGARGNAFGYPAAAPLAPADEASLLQSQAESLSSALKDIQGRIAALEAGSQEKKEKK
jgi:hypothetical protein